MSRKLPWLLVILGAAPGCSDNLDAMLRHSLNHRNEIIDMMMQLNSEEEAKVFTKKKDDLINEFDKLFRERIEKWEKTFGKKQINDLIWDYCKEKQKENPDEPPPRFNIHDVDMVVFKKVLEKKKVKETRDELEAVFLAAMDYAKKEKVTIARLRAATERLKQIREGIKLEKVPGLEKQGVAKETIEKIKTRTVDELRTDEIIDGEVELSKNWKSLDTLIKWAVRVPERMPIQAILYASSGPGGGGPILLKKGPPGGGPDGGGGLPGGGPDGGGGPGGGGLPGGGPGGGGLPGGGPGGGGPGVQKE